MASTITSANLTVTISESIMINGIEQGNTNSVTIAGIKEVSRRIITVGTSGEAELVLLDANDGTAPFNESDVMYIRITNLDDTNYMRLTFKDESGQEFAVRLNAGQTFIYNGDKVGSTGVVNSMDAQASALTWAPGDLVNITAQAYTSSCDVEVFVASE